MLRLWTACCAPTRESGTARRRRLGVTAAIGRNNGYKLYVVRTRKAKLNRHVPMVCMNSCCCICSASFVHQHVPGIYTYTKRTQQSTSVTPPTAYCLRVLYCRADWSLRLLPTINTINTTCTALFQERVMQHVRVLKIGHVDRKHQILFCLICATCTVCTQQYTAVSLPTAYCLQRTYCHGDRNICLLPIAIIYQVRGTRLPSCSHADWMFRFLCLYHCPREYGTSIATMRDLPRQRCGIHLRAQR